MQARMSIEIAPLSRPLLGLVVVVALANLGWRSPDLTMVSAKGEDVFVEPVGAPSGAWSVGVDGWRIVVDGIAIATDRPPTVALDPEEGGNLRLDRLALYADSIGRYAAEERIDWRLVAAVIYEESAFQADALSPAGAFGLMQVKEEAAREVGVFPYGDPDSNIRAGVRYLAAMRSAFPAGGTRDQLAMMLAAYNMGPGHMRDARALARALALPANTWDGAVALAVPLLERPDVYQRLRHGFAQGNNVVRYVERVLRRYGAYRTQFPDLGTPSRTMIAELASR